MPYADWIQQRDQGNSQRRDEAIRGIIQTMMSMQEQQTRNKQLDFQQTMAQRQAALEQSKYELDARKEPAYNDYMKAQTEYMKTLSEKDTDIPWVKSAKAWVKETGGQMSEAVKLFAPTEKPYEDPAATDARRFRYDKALIDERNIYDEKKATAEAYRVDKADIRASYEKWDSEVKSVRNQILQYRKMTVPPKEKEKQAEKDQAIAELKQQQKDAERRRDGLASAMMSFGRGATPETMATVKALANGDFDATPTGSGFDPAERRALIDHYLSSPNAKMYPPGERERFISTYVDDMIAKGLIKPGALGRVKKL